jgi:hypothetical protein
MGHKKNAHRIFVGILKRVKRPLGRPTQWENNIKMDRHYLPGYRPADVLTVTDLFSTTKGGLNFLKCEQISVYLLHATTEGVCRVVGRSCKITAVILSGARQITGLGCDTIQFTDVSEELSRSNELVTERVSE